MTEPLNRAGRIRARQLADDGHVVPTEADNLRIAAENREHDQRSLAAGLQAKPMTNWQEIADMVDEPTWQRILADLNPETRAECEAIRPPAGLPETLADRQAGALNRLRRQKPAYNPERRTNP